jgi:ribosomal protein L40E
MQAVRSGAPPLLLIFTETQLLECYFAPRLRPGTIRWTIRFDLIQDQNIEELLRENPQLSALDYALIAQITFSEKHRLTSPNMLVELTNGERREYRVSFFWTQIAKSPRGKWPEHLTSALAQLTQLGAKGVRVSDEPWKHAPWKPGPITEEDKKYMKQCHTCQAWIPVAAETCDKCGAKQTK